MYFQGGAIIAPPRWPILMYKPVETLLAGCPRKALSQNKCCKAARAKKKMLKNNKKRKQNHVCLSSQTKFDMAITK